MASAARLLRSVPVGDWACWRSLICRLLSLKVELTSIWTELLWPKRRRKSFGAMNCRRRWRRFFANDDSDDDDDVDSDDNDGDDVGNNVDSRQRRQRWQSTEKRGTDFTWKTLNQKMLQWIRFYCDKNNELEIKSLNPAHRKIRLKRF